MPTIVQLSETLYLNMDQVAVIRLENGQWRVWLSDPTTSLVLSRDENVVLGLYLRNHCQRATYAAWQRGVQE